MREIRFPPLSDDDGDVPILVSLHFMSETVDPTDLPMQNAVSAVLRDLRRVDRLALVEYLRSNGYQNLAFMATNMEVGQIARLTSAELTSGTDEGLVHQSKVIEVNESLASMHDGGILTCNVLASGVIALMLQVHGSTVESVTKSNLREIAEAGRRFDLKLRQEIVDRYSSRSKNVKVNNGNERIQLVDMVIKKYHIRENSIPAVTFEFRIAVEHDEIRTLDYVEKALDQVVMELNPKSLHQIAEFLSSQATESLTIRIRHLSDFDTDIAFGFGLIQNRETGALRAELGIGDQALRSVDPMKYLRLSITGCLAQALAISEGHDPKSWEFGQLLPWVRKLGYLGPWSVR